MELLDDEALVLDSTPFRDRHLVVVLLTRRHGVVRGVLRNARGGRQPAAGMVQLLSRLRVTLHQRAAAEMATIRSVDLLRSSYPLARQVPATAAAAVTAELLLSFCPPAEPAERQYRLGCSVLEGLLGGADAATAVSYAALWTLALGGVLPSLERCSACDEPTSTAPVPHPSTGQLVCRSCAGPSAEPFDGNDLRFLSECRRCTLGALTQPAPPRVRRWAELLVRLEADRPLRALDFFQRHVDAANG